MALVICKMLIELALGLYKIAKDREASVFHSNGNLNGHEG